MSSEIEKNAVVLSDIDRETVRRMFTRKIDIAPKFVKLNDEAETRKFLQLYREHEEKQKGVQAAVGNFNPDNDIVIPKELLNLVEGFKTLTTIKTRVDSIADYVDTVKSVNIKSPAVKKVKPTSKEERLINIKAKLTQPRKRF